VANPWDSADAGTRLLHEKTVGFFVRIEKGLKLRPRPKGRDYGYRFGELLEFFALYYLFRDIYQGGDYIVRSTLGNSKSSPKDELEGDA